MLLDSKGKVEQEAITKRETMQMRQKLYCKKDQGPQADAVLAAVNHQTEIRTGSQ